MNNTIQIKFHSNSYNNISGQNINFKGLSRIRTATDAFEILSQRIKSGDSLTQKDEKWLSRLRKVFGVDNFSVNNPDNPKEIIKINSSLTREKINQEGGIQSLAKALRTMIAATKYKPAKVHVSGTVLSVHNRKLAGLLRTEYDQTSFSNLMHYLNGKRLFDMTDNPRFGLIIDSQKGIVKTCGAGENWEMSDRAWITDIMRVGDIQKHKRPQSWTQALNTIGDFYHRQNATFKRLIANPELYREGDSMQGIPHIFMPATLEPDVNWFNNKRLESHGLALKEFCNGITDGLVRGKKHGYKTAQDVPENVTEAIDNLVKYFKAINYSNAPSAGNWEEIPIKGGLTSDTEAIRSAIGAYRNLMFNPRYNDNKEIMAIRARINALSPVSKEETTKLIKDGEKRIRATYLEEAPDVRPKDASLVFITTSDVKLADNVIDDVKKHVEILESLEHNLVRENGIIRYAPFNFRLKDGTVGHSPDSYLNLNYFTAVDKNGKLNLDWKNILDKFASKDCSEPEMFFARAKLSTPDKEAQWFMVSEMSTGYGMQIEKILHNAKREQRNLTSEEAALVKKLKKKQTEFLNRAIARISDENPNEINQIKANGLNMPSVTVSEAHQFVTDTNGKEKMMQGTNAPLSWAVASLYKALKKQQSVLEKLNS